MNDVVTPEKSHAERDSRLGLLIPYVCFSRGGGGRIRPRTTVRGVEGGDERWVDSVLPRRTLKKKKGKRKK